MAKIVKGFIDMAGKYRCYVVGDDGNEIMLKFDKEPEEATILKAYDAATAIPEKTLQQIEAEEEKARMELAEKQSEVEKLAADVEAKQKELGVYEPPPEKTLEELEAEKALTQAELDKIAADIEAKRKELGLDVEEPIKEVDDGAIVSK